MFASNLHGPTFSRAGVTQYTHARFVIRRTILRRIAISYSRCASQIHLNRHNARTNRVRKGRRSSLQPSFPKAPLQPLNSRTESAAKYRECASTCETQKASDKCPLTFL
jgi:hypothetical protein